MRRYRWANTPPEKRKFLRKSQLRSQDFTAKLFCNVEFWIERLAKLIEARPEVERLVVAGTRLQLLPQVGSNLTCGGSWAKLLADVERKR
jgi:hypothetical protein